MNLSDHTPMMQQYLGIKADPEFVADLIEQGQVLQMDAGQVTNEAGETFLFALMVGCGFDGDVAERLANRRKGHITKFSYFIPVLTAVWKYRYPKMYVQDLADEHNQFHARFLFVMNIRRYALKLMVAPEADPTDGKLDACGFVKPGFLHGLKYFWQLWWSTHHRRSTDRVRTVRNPLVRHRPLGGRARHHGRGQGHRQRRSGGCHDHHGRGRARLERQDDLDIWRHARLHGGVVCYAGRATRAECAR